MRRKISLLLIVMMMLFTACTNSSSENENTKKDAETNITQNSAGDTLLDEHEVTYLTESDYFCPREDEHVCYTYINIRETTDGCEDGVKKVYMEASTSECLNGYGWLPVDINTGTVLSFLYGMEDGSVSFEYNGETISVQHLNGIGGGSRIEEVYCPIDYDGLAFVLLADYKYVESETSETKTYTLDELVNLDTAEYYFFRYEENTSTELPPMSKPAARAQALIERLGISSWYWEVDDSGALKIEDTDTGNVYDENGEYLYNSYDAS